VSPADFIAAVAPGAQAAQLASGVPASITIGQAAIESGWGGHAPGSNLFGIKADASWTGPTTGGLMTQEDDGGAHAEVAAFRAYPSWAASIADHAAFLQENPRYAPCFATSSAQDFAAALQACGYSTNPAYAQLLSGIIAYHNLTQYDSPTPPAAAPAAT
jgi:flagellar protein FlgJ